MKQKNNLLIIIYMYVYLIFEHFLKSLIFYNIK